MRVNGFINNGNKLIYLFIEKPNTLASLLNQLVSFIFRPRTDEQTPEINPDRFVQLKWKTIRSN